MNIEGFTYYNVFKILKQRLDSVCTMVNQVFAKQYLAPLPEPGICS